MNVGSTPGEGIIPMRESNPISGFIGMLVIFVGFAMMVYAFKKQ